MVDALSRVDVNASKKVAGEKKEEEGRLRLNRLAKGGRMNSLKQMTKPAGTRVKEKKSYALIGEPVLRKRALSRAAFQRALRVLAVRGFLALHQDCQAFGPQVGPPAHHVEGGLGI